MRQIDADELLRKVEYDEYYHSNEIKVMIEDTPTIAPPPNDPLTLEELREMDGEPVFLSFGAGFGEWTIVLKSPEPENRILLLHKNGVSSPARLVSECGGRIYRRKPEEVDKS